MQPHDPLQVGANRYNFESKLNSMGDISSIPHEHTPSGEAGKRVLLAALYHLALADGVFAASERELLEKRLRQDLPGISLDELKRPGDAALCHRLGVGTPLAEEFLRNAVMVAMADGFISQQEVTLLQHWSTQLDVGKEVVMAIQSDCSETEHTPEVIEALRRWLDRIEPSDRDMARFLVRLIPAQCPFERDVVVFGKKLVHIPPMCKINPLYEQLSMLRFRCLCFLESCETKKTADPT